jgi:transmembrane sensor
MDDPAFAEAGAWLVRLQRPEVSEEDGVAFEAWLATPANRAAYASALSVWHAYEASAAEVLAELEAPVRPRRARPMVGRRWMVGAGGFAVAAGLALAIMPGLLARPTVTSYDTGKGQHQHIALADGSVIDIDAETRLTVELGRTTRRVSLMDGEAIFDVAHDAKRPFVVAASGREVRVVGTQFDVRNREGGLTVTVARGRVQVQPASPATQGRAFLLTPGLRLAIDQAGVEQLKTVDPQETFSWRSGRLVYRETPLADVVADLNRQFPEQIEIGDPELGKIPITGVIVLDNPRAVVARLSLLLPVRSVPSERGLQLLRK